MAGNSFGTLFRFTSWGESHGPAIGCVVDGTPPRLPLSEADIQVWMEKRRPGQSRFVTQRQEPDTVKILSGVFEGLTTGTPIALHIDTGKLAWYYQHLPGDDWDEDYPHERTLTRAAVRPDPKFVKWINPDVRRGETREIALMVGEGGGVWGRAMMTSEGVGHARGS